MTVAAGNYGLREASASLSTSGALGDSLLALSETLRKAATCIPASSRPSRPAGRERPGRRACATPAATPRRGRLRLLLLAGERCKEDPVAPYDQTFGVPGANITDRWVVFGAQYDKALTPATKWQAQIDVIDYRYDGNYPTANRRPSPIAISQPAVAGAREPRVTTAFDRHTLVAGVEARLDRAVEQSNFDVDPYASYLDSKHDVSSYGVFANDEFALDGDWRINAGLRLDRDDSDTVRLSPRLALISAPAGDTTFRRSSAGLTARPMPTSASTTSRARTARNWPIPTWARKHPDRRVVLRPQPGRAHPRRAFAVRLHAGEPHHPGRGRGANADLGERCQWLFHRRRAVAPPLLAGRRTDTWQLFV